MRYWIEAMPDPSAPSVAVSVNDGRVVYQPPFPVAPGMASVVTGAVVSWSVSSAGTTTWTCPVARLPAASVAR